MNIRRIRMASIVAILVSLAVIVDAVELGRAMELLRDRVADLGVVGMIIFGLLYVLAALFFVPGAALTLSAGAIFGLVAGTAIVSISSTIAAASAFLIARYVARDRVRELAGRTRRFSAIDRAIGDGGWKVIALLRLSPAIPFSAGNYLFGLTSTRFSSYVLASWAFMLPGTFMYVYFGHFGLVSLSAAGEGSSTDEADVWKLVATVVGLIATVAVTVYITRLASRALREKAELDDATTPQSDADDAGQPAPRSAWKTIGLVAVALSTIGMAGLAHVNRDRLQYLFGPPRVELGEAYADDRVGATFDHSLLDDLLRRHVKPGGRVDYAALGRERGALDLYLASLQNARFAELGRDEKLALLINAYNAFTLELIVEHFPAIKSINDIPDAERWNSRRWRIDGEIVSLNELEHEHIRPKFREPRVHFALVCAAVGCPPLRAEAYVGTRLEQQLEEQARYVHEHDRWLRFDAESNVLHLTPLYSWYGDDFVQVAGSVAAHAARYVPALQGALENEEPDIEWLEYDWSLNSTENPK